MATENLIMAGGCFWCTEAVFQRLRGVEEVTCGYAGGSADDANYDSVCTGTTDHAEAISITFDDTRITLDTLLDVFFHIAHDPTQLDRQGNDVGRQYRSAIFYRDNDEKSRLEQAMADSLQRLGLRETTVATQLEPMVAFYTAEAYHQNYANQHPMQPYIFCVARPKVAKLEAIHPDLLKT